MKRALGLILALGMFVTSGAHAVRIRVGLLPILETLPVHVAKEKGYFGEGLQVELIPVASAAERDQLVASGEIDVIINDLVSAVLFNRKGQQVLVVMTARAATPKFPQFFVLGAPGSGLKNPSDLKGVPIAISEATIIHYVTERLLQREGLRPSEIRFVPIPRIPDRMAALNSGKVKAATLPDPLSLLALQQGAVLIMDDSWYPEYSLSVYSFRRDFVRKYPEAVRTFLGAIGRAVKEINSDKSRWRNLLVEKKLVPPPLKGSYRIPDLPFGSVPSRAQWEDVLNWAIEKGLIGRRIPYEEAIVADYLP